MHNYRPIIVLVSSLAAGIVLLVAMTYLVAEMLADRVPPHSMTRTRMWVMESRIRGVFQKSGVVSNDPASLPNTGDDRDNSTIDGWGRSIIMIVERGTVRLVSYGRDGVPGGEGDDADIVHLIELK